MSSAVRAGSMSDRILMAPAACSRQVAGYHRPGSRCNINGGIKPVRKALNRLENRGLVESKEGKAERAAVNVPGSIELFPPGDK